MKITHNKVGQNLNNNDSKESSKSQKSGASAKTAAPEAALAELGKTTKGNESAKVNVSDRARDIKKAKELATAAPDVDEAKVARLQKMIDDGKYKVEAKDIADKMVDEELAWS